MSKVVLEIIKKSLFIWAILSSVLLKGQNSFETSFFSAYESIISGEPKSVANSWNSSHKVYILSEAQDSLSWESEQLPDYYSNSFARFFFAGGMTTKDETNYTLWLDQKALFQFQPSILQSDTILYSYRGSSLTFHQQKESEEAKEFFVELRLPLQMMSLGEQVQLKLTDDSDEAHRFWLYDLKPQAPFRIQNKHVTKRGFETELQKLVLDLFYFSSEKPEFDLDVNGKTRVRDTLAFGYNKWEIEIETGREPKWTELDMFRNDSLVKYIGYESKPLPYHEIYIVPNIQDDSTGVENIDKLAGHIAGMGVLENLLDSLSEIDRMKYLYQLQTGAVSFNLSSRDDFTGENTFENYYDNLAKGMSFAKEHNLNGKALQLNNPNELSESIVSLLKMYGVEYLSIKHDDLPLVKTKEIDKYPYFYWKSGDAKLLCQWYHYGFASSLLSEDVISEHLSRKENSRYKISRMDVKLDNIEALHSFVDYWNTTYSSPKLIVSSLDQYFDKFKQQYGEKIPELSYNYIGFSPMITDVFPVSSSELQASKNELKQWKSAALFAPDSFRSAFLQNELALNRYESNLENLTFRNISEHQSLDKDSLYQANPFTIEKYYEGITEVDSMFVVSNPGEAMKDAYISIPETWSRAYKSVYIGKKEQLTLSQRMSDGSLLVYLKKVPAYGSVNLRLSANVASLESDLLSEASSISNSRIKASYTKDGYLNGLQRKDIAAQYIYENDIWGGLFEKSGASLSLWESPSTKRVVEKGPLCYKIEWLSEDESIRYKRSLVLYAWADSFEWEVTFTILSDDLIADNYLSFPFLLEKPTYKYRTERSTEGDKFRYEWKRRHHRMPEAIAYQVEGLEKACQLSMSKDGPFYARRLDFVSDWLPSFGDNGFLYQLKSGDNEENTFSERFRFRPAFRSNPIPLEEQALLLLPSNLLPKDFLMRWDNENISLKYFKPNEEGDVIAVFYNNSSEEQSLKLKTSFKKKIECDPYGEARNNLGSKKKIAPFGYFHVKLRN